MSETIDVDNNLQTSGEITTGDQGPSPAANIRKPLDAQFVGKINQAAMKALADTKARRKWPDSSAGSPVTANILCAEIARMNIVQADLLDALYGAEAAMASHNLSRLHEGSECPWDFAEGLGGTLDKVRAAIAKATSALPDRSEPTQSQEAR